MVTVTAKSHYEGKHSTLIAIWRVKMVDDIDCAIPQIYSVKACFTHQFNIYVACKINPRRNERRDGLARDSKRKFQLYFRDESSKLARVYTYAHQAFEFIADLTPRKHTLFTFRRAAQFRKIAQETHQLTNPTLITIPIYLVTQSN